MDERTQGAIPRQADIETRLDVGETPINPPRTDGATLVDVYFEFRGGERDLSVHTLQRFQSPSGSTR